MSEMDYSMNKNVNYWMTSPIISPKSESTKFVNAILLIANVINVTFIYKYFD